MSVFVVSEDEDCCIIEFCVCLCFFRSQLRSSCDQGMSRHIDDDDDMVMVMMMMLVI